MVGRRTCMALTSTSGACCVKGLGRWCRKSAKLTALSEWKDCTALYATSDSTPSSARLICVRHTHTQAGVHTRAHTHMHTSKRRRRTRLQRFVACSVLWRHGAVGSAAVPMQPRWLRGHACWKGPPK